MPVDFGSVRKLEDAQIKQGQRWIYSADFNIKHVGTTLESTGRIDTEIEDLKRIIINGGRVAILAHKGRHKDEDTEELDYVVPYLSKKLGVQSKYHFSNNSYMAADFIDNLKPGEVAVMGNTRVHEGEEENSASLAEQYSRLGERVAVGGFGKAHRVNASNVGILDYLPGYATRSQLREMELLAPWTGRSKEYSVAVLGGVKKEKITIGLKGFAETYDAVIPGGIVLNTALRVMGYDVGDSVLDDGGKTFENNVKKILDGPNGNRVLLPDTVMVAERTEKGFGHSRKIKIKEGVPKGSAIVDFLPTQKIADALDRVVDEHGRLVVAGTPGVMINGYTIATNTVFTRLTKPGVRGLVLGGDTTAEIKYKGTTSTGGGSALAFVTDGTTEVFKALQKNRLAFA
ncbi:MAG: phosphoglycerate kinase [Candidatus Aenigmatarchaeota archaeon]|nr:MAG: phosphoglycerate kinase [Candidatus Aenigmarchaeota archaeon]